MTATRLLQAMRGRARAGAVACILAAFPGAACLAQASRAPGRPASPAQRDSGVITVTSAASFDSTVARLERAATAGGLTIAAKVDHAAAAKRAGLTLRPTTLIVAGNPAAGTPLMQTNQAIGVDLPLRFLVWEDAGGRVQVTYNTIASLAGRHGVTGREALVAKMTTGIDGIVKAATGR